MNKDLDNSPVDTPIEVKKTICEIHMTLRKLLGYNNKSRAWNCNMKNLLRRQRRALESGMTVLGLATHLVRDDLDERHKQQTQFVALGSRLKFPISMGGLK